MGRYRQKFNLRMGRSDGQYMMSAAVSDRYQQFRAHVIVIDNREVDGRRIVRALADLGCRAAKADAGVPAHIIRSENPDLLFVSTAVPSNAREVTARIRVCEREDAARGFEPRHVPIIGYGGTSRRPSWCVDIGMDDFQEGSLDRVTIAHLLETWTPHTLTLAG